MDMKKHNAQTPTHPMERRQLSILSKYSHVSLRNDSSHSHTTVRASDSNRAIAPQSSRGSFPSFDGSEINSLNRVSLEILNRDLYRQHVEDTKYLEKRRMIQHHYRSLIEYERLRYTSELERLSASISFLDQQDELDREFEQRIRVQEQKLKMMHQRLEHMARVTRAEGVSNPLFNPEVMASW